MVNAIPHQLPQKRAPIFRVCHSDTGSPSPATISVVIDPDPVIPGKPNTFTVTGTVESDITDQTQLIAFYTDTTTKADIGEVYYIPICTGNACPIKAKTQFTVKATLDTPETLPNPYSIVVGIVDQPGTILACTAANIGNPKRAPDVAG
ncbi:9384_t:CDS:1, partial [Funneliformis mosseae]